MKKYNDATHDLQYQSGDSKQVPKIAYSVYKKYYEEPTEAEGFESIYII